VVEVTTTTIRAAMTISPLTRLLRRHTISDFERIFAHKPSK